MSYPGPPTDNLYKFLAVTGVLIAFIPAQFAFQRGVELSIQLQESQGRVQMLDISVRELKKKTKDLEVDRKQLDNAIIAVKRDWSARNVSNKKLSDRAEQLDAIRRKLNKDAQEMQKTLVSTRFAILKSATEVAIGKTTLLALRIYIVIALLCFMIGLYLAWFGFSKWYELYQRPTDIAARRELDRLLSGEAGSEKVNRSPTRRFWLQKYRL